MNDKYTKVLGSDGYDTILKNGSVVFVGTSLACMAWVVSNRVFISEVF